MGILQPLQLLFFFGGVQLVSIGILGEYIGKIYYEVKKRPHFIVEKTNIEQAEKDRVG